MVPALNAETLSNLGPDDFDGWSAELDAALGGFDLDTLEICCDEEGEGPPPRDSRRHRLHAGREPAAEDGEIVIEEARAVSFFAEAGKRYVVGGALGVEARVPEPGAAAAALGGLAALGALSSPRRPRRRTPAFGL